MRLDELPPVPGVEHRFVDLGGWRMHVAEVGEGPPVLLLHGWPQHWWMWRKVAPRLAERHRVLCADLRGFGWSDAPPDGYDKETLAADLLRLLDALGVGRSCLAGHDWGGVVGFIACLRAPERFERFLALNCGHPWPVLGRGSPRDIPRFAYMVALATPLAGRELQRRANLLPRALGPAVGWGPEERHAYLAPLRDTDHAAAASSTYREFLLRDLPGWLLGRYRDARLRPRTLMLHGARDPVIRPHMLEGFEEHADDMRLELVPDAGHFVVDEKPELVAERALELFAA